MPQITRRLEFDAGHRILGHGGKCRFLHGHRYRSEITVNSLGLDGLGMVIDFGEVKRLVVTWIDQHWDHNMILNPDDPLLDAVLFPGTSKNPTQEPTSEQIFGNRIPFIMPRSFPNPTVENMARVLFEESELLLNEKGISVERVRLYETPNCWADCRGGL